VLRARALLQLAAAIGLAANSLLSAEESEEVVVTISQLSR